MQNSTTHIMALSCLWIKAWGKREETHWGCWSWQTRSHTWCRGRWLKPGANQNVAAIPGTNSTVKSLMRCCKWLVKVEQTCKPGAISARPILKTQASVYFNLGYIYLFMIKPLASLFHLIWDRLAFIFRNMTISWLFCGMSSKIIGIPCIHLEIF